MTTINLKDFYPWYTHDEYIEVSEEVADELGQAGCTRPHISGGSFATRRSIPSTVRTGSNTPPAFPNPPRRSCWSAWNGSAICALRSILCPKRRAAGWTPV